MIMTGRRLHVVAHLDVTTALRASRQTDPVLPSFSLTGEEKIVVAPASPARGMSLSGATKLPGYRYRTPPRNFDTDWQLVRTLVSVPPLDGQADPVCAQFDLCSRRPASQQV
jgi:hypothetical protein